MRILPDNPSVDFLRQEAKDILAALRETAPETPLAEAQRTLAHEYGFRTWADLKADVERRRDAAPPGDPALADALAGAFALGAVTGPLLPVGMTYPGRTWSLTTERGRYLASPVWDWMSDEQLDVAADLRERARAAGVRSPVPVRDPDGRQVHRFHDQGWRLDEWADLGPVPLLPARSAIAARVGEVIGTLHSVGPPTDRPVGPYLVQRHSEAHWLHLLDLVRRAGKPWAGELEAGLATILELDGVRADPPPGRLICNSNVIVESVRHGAGDDLVVVHWDYAGPLPPMWELANVLIHWTLHGYANLPAARAMLDGYEARAGTRPSLDLTSFTAAVSGHLNWVFGVCCEALDPDGPDRAEYTERAAVAMLVDPPLTVAKVERFLDGLAAARSG